MPPRIRRSGTALRALGDERPTQFCQPQIVPDLRGARGIGIRRAAGERDRSNGAHSRPNATLRKSKRLRENEKSARTLQQRSFAVVFLAPEFQGVVARSGQVKLHLAAQACERTSYIA